MHTVSENEYLVQHNGTVTNVGQYIEIKCNVCQIVFLDQTNFKKHFCNVANSEAYKCLKCEDRRYAFVEDLMLHLKSHKNPDDENFNCHICSEGFPSRCQLNEHVHFHDAYFKCAYCPLIFNGRSLLNKHEKQHADEQRLIDKDESNDQLSNLQYPEEPKVPSPITVTEVVDWRYPEEPEVPWPITEEVVDWRYPFESKGLWPKNEEIVDAPTAKKPKVVLPRRLVNPQKRSNTNTARCKICKRCFTRKIHLIVHLRTHKRKLFKKKSVDRITNSSHKEKFCDKKSSTLSRSERLERRNKSLTPKVEPPQSISPVLMRLRDRSTLKKRVDLSSMETAPKEISIVSEQKRPKPSSKKKTKCKVNLIEKARTQNSRENENEETETNEFKVSSSSLSAENKICEINKLTDCNTKPSKKSTNAFPAAILSENEKATLAKKCIEEAKVNGLEDQPSCKICGNKYRHKPDLIRHYRMHARIHLYKCKLCSKTFYRADYLQKHMMSKRHKY